MDPVEGSPRWLRITGIIAGLAAFALVMGVSGIQPAPARAAAAVSSLMAIWWLTEALTITVTACLPLVLFPLLGVFPGGMLKSSVTAALPYVDPYMFLFVGGMAIAAAMQECGLHRRVALHIMKWIGTDPKRLLLGVLVATATISLWISNTATAAMMMPIGMAVIAQCEVQEKRGRLVFFGAAIMLAVAYGANIGGIGTKVGTVPNAQFCGHLEKELGIPVTFLRYLMIGLPFVVMLLPVAWFTLWRVARRDKVTGGSDVVDRELAALGPVRRVERVVFAMFLVAAVLWILSGPITASLKSRIGGLKSSHVEASVALLCGFSLMAMRSEGRWVLTIGALRKVPWSTLLLLGGGFAMAAGIDKSGLSDWMAGKLGGMRSLPAVGQIAVAAFSTIALSAVASNTATLAVMLNVFTGATLGGETSAAAKAHTATVLGAAAIASSCDFMLPAGTPPNAIVFGSGYVSIPRMAKTGFVLDIAAALLATAWAATGVWAVFR